MKSAVFSLAALVFALGLAGTLGTGYGSYNYGGGYDSYDQGYGYAQQGLSGYGHKGGRYESTVHIPYAVPVPQAMPMPAYGAVGGSDDSGLFGLGEESLLLILPFLLLLFTQANTNSG